MRNEGSRHKDVVEILRQRCVGAPAVSMGPGRHNASKTGTDRRLELLRPLLKAAWRIAVFRSNMVFTFGLVLIIILMSKKEPIDRTHAWPLVQLLVGCLCCVLGLVGVPGAVAWLEVKTAAGFHSNEAMSNGPRNRRIRKMFQAWLANVQQCPYIRSGETCTLLPFFWNPNRAASLHYTRVWLLSSDGERFACDWVFPPCGHDSEKPVVILLTGLAPHKHWTKGGGFVGDVVWHLSCRRGITVVVLVPRGTMDTVVTEHLFNGARTSDVRDTILLMEGALQEAYGPERKTPLIGVGFSMGGITLANYCGQYGSDTRLLGGIHFSGGYDAIFNMKFKYATSTWQVYLAYNLKKTYLRPNMVEIAKRRGVDVDRVLSRHVESITDFDTEFMVAFNGYKCVEEYYKDLGVAGWEKWRAVAIPLLAVSARDDPFLHCDSLRAGEFVAANDNLLFLITERGGHVGWPLGWRPWQHGFDFMNEAVDVFICSALQ